MVIGRIMAAAGKFGYMRAAHGVLMRMSMKRCAPLLLVFAACSSPPSDDSALSSEAVNVDDLKVQIQSIDASGDLCPAGSVSGVYNAPGAITTDAFTVLFSAATLDGTATKSCKVTLTMKVPDGYQLSSPFFYSRGFASGNAKLETKYSFTGAGGSQSFQHDVGADYAKTDRFTGVWSPSCSNATVKLAIEITGSAIGADSSFALDSIDSAFAYRDGVKWQQCGATGPIDPGPNDKGGYCGGVQNRGCKAGLECEYAENALEGTCVDPQESVPEVPKHERCGGWRNIGCQSGLVCRWIRQQGKTEHKLGLCTPPTGQEDDICGGYPNVPCASGLTCYAENSSCVRANGEFKSRCGEGLTPCQSGLYCNGTWCAYPSVGEGEACGGPKEIGCTRPLKCKDGVCAK